MALPVASVVPRRDAASVARYCSVRLGRSSGLCIGIDGHTCKQTLLVLVYTAVVAMLNSGVYIDSIEWWMLPGMQKSGLAGEKWPLTARCKT